MDKYYPNKRFSPLDVDKSFVSPYDVSDAAIQDMVARNIAPFQVYVFNLAVASFDPQTMTAAKNTVNGDWIKISTPGNMILLLGSDATVIQAVNTQAFMECIVSRNAPSNDAVGFPLKHNRGLPGPFESFYVRWPAQSGVYGRLVVFRYSGAYWVNGEAAT